MSTEQEIHPSQRDRQLPMLLNLRGDELLADDFCIDAEQAMEMLGIKRSRLTQISGRELRVGRMRRDRYIRPFYRECDLRDYQEWTRATATHQSSSKAIEQAIDGLDDRFNDVFVVLHERLEQFQAREDALLRERFAHMQRQLDARLQALAADLRSRAQAMEALRRDSELGLKLQRRLGAWQAEAGASQRSSAQRLDAFHQDMREALLRLNLLRRDIEDWSLRRDESGRDEQRLREQAQSRIELTITEFLCDVDRRLGEFVQAQAAAEKASEDKRRPLPRLLRRRGGVKRSLPYLKT